MMNTEHLDNAPRILRNPTEANTHLPSIAVQLFRSARFVMSVADLAALPAPALPEIAFAGRSNAGKSSAINALTDQKRLAFASKTPGRTQLLNFFELSERNEERETVVRGILVDLPGYGYAEAPKDLVARWKRLIFDYLRGRAVLRRVLVLIDARHGLKPVDIEIMTMLDKAAVSYQIVLTKADKIKPTALAATLAAVDAQSRTHAAAFPEVLATSAETGTGMGELRAAVVLAAKV